MANGWRSWSVSFCSMALLDYRQSHRVEKRVARERESYLRRRGPTVSKLFAIYFTKWFWKHRNGSGVFGFTIAVINLFCFVLFKQLSGIDNNWEGVLIYFDFGNRLWSTMKGSAFWWFWKIFLRFTPAENINNKKTFSMLSNHVILRNYSTELMMMIFEESFHVFILT